MGSGVSFLSLVLETIPWYGAGRRGECFSTPQRCGHGTHISATKSDTGSQHREHQNVAHSKTMGLGIRNKRGSSPPVQW